MNRSGSVGEEEKVGVVGSCHIQFLLSFICLSFIFFSCFPLSLSHVFLDFRTLVTLLSGNASAPLNGFLLLRLANVTKGGSKTWVMDFRVVELS